MNYLSKQLDGKRVDYVDQGEGKVILFIHGWGVTPRAYQEDIELLSKKYRVIAPKIHKFGKTQQKIHILKQIIAMLSVSHIVLLGHSASGVLAVLLATKFPGKIAGIILIDSMGIQDGRGKKEWLVYWLKHIVSLAKRSGKRSHASLLSLASDFFYETFRHPLASYEQVNSAIAIDLVPYLKELKIPILILWGRQDDLTPVSDSFVFLQSAKHVTLDLVSGTHDWLKLHPKLFAEKVDTFMQKIPA